MSKIQKLKIGNIELNNNLLLAPMAGISDLPMRLLSKEGGAGLVYTEMVSARALVYGDEKTKKLFKIHKNERPVAVQIFGGDAYSMGEAAKIIRDSGADIIDINMGCPVRKIAKAGAGAKLLANEALTADIMETVAKSVNIPVTIKIRIGLLPGQNVAPEIIKIAYETGIKMAAVHARPASQGHSGEADIEAFAAACDGAKIPVVANGGIIDELSAEKFYKIPGCSGLMIGKGAVGNYSLFKRIESYFGNGILLDAPPWREKIDWFKKHAELAARYYGEEKGYILLRKVSHYYVKDLPNAAKVRNMFNKVTKTADFEEVLKCIYDNAFNKDAES
ncbi:MAG: tRNA dihydrouridine synthase DusB [Endomicrobia bacterium]|nr:tRNA dihydrouridine synthase DusB [Endomicrobiia bacterium]